MPIVDEISKEEQMKIFEEGQFLMRLDTKCGRLVGTRWTRDGLELHLQGLGAKGTLDDIDETGLFNDYAFIMGVFENYGYIDINYLKIPYGDEDIYITEMTVEEE